MAPWGRWGPKGTVIPGFRALLLTANPKYGNHLFFFLFSSRSSSPAFDQKFIKLDESNHRNCRKKIFKVIVP